MASLGWQEELQRQQEREAPALNVPCQAFLHLWGPLCRPAQAAGATMSGMRVAAAAREESDQTMATGSKESQISQVQHRISFRANSAKGNK